MGVYEAESAFLRLILLSLCVLVDTMSLCQFARAFPNQTKTELIKNSTLQGDKGCGPYCTNSIQQGTCCERFGLNVYNNSGIVLSASSEYDSLHGVQRAALFEIEESTGMAAWAPATMNTDQWIQVDFGHPRHVTGILLQGRGQDCCDQWVTSFRVLFSEDEEVFYSTEVMEGTFDRHTVARRFFDRPITARYFRINPVTWSGNISLRFDLLGCSV